MTYQLGIDVGTTTVVAAVSHVDGPGEAEVVPLGAGGATVPSALHLARDGGVTVGDGALRLAGIDPGRVVRALPRRIGDPAPVTLGGRTWTAEDLYARLVRWVVDRVAEHESGPAARITLTHPAPWATSTLERLAAALAGVDVKATLLAEPLAVAQAARADGGPGDTIAVYDLGGGRFDAAVVRRDAAGFGMLGRPEGLADVGGLDLDHLVWQHVRAGLPEGTVPDARVRRACLKAKETLSAKAEAVVRVRQGELRGDARLDRGTFEGLVAAHVDRTVDVLRRVVSSAGLAPRELTAVLLVGGSARIPLVARTVSAKLGRAVTVLDDPAWVARGAALTDPAPVVDVVADDAGPVLFRLPERTRTAEPEVVAAGPDQGPATAVVAAPAAERAAEQLQPVEPAPAPVAEPMPPADAEPAAAEPAVVEPAVADAAIEDPMVAEHVAEGPVAEEPAVAEPSATSPSAEDPSAEDPGAGEPARRAVPVRTPAVLDAAHRRDSRSRSLPRLLVGVGAVAAAALVVVALFRPDGPLDPPLEPTAGVPRVTEAPVVPASLPTAADPATDGFPGGHPSLGGAPAAARMTEPLRPRMPDAGGEADRAVVDRPVERAAVDSVDPAGDDRSPDATSAPDVRMTGPGPAARDTAGQGGHSPIGAATRVPPTPAAPRA